MRYLRLPHLHPDRADLAEFLNDPGERAHHLVEVLLRRGAAERKPERRMGVFVWLSEREEDMRWIKRDRGAGGARGYRDALRVKVQNHRLAFDIEDRDVDVVRQPLGRVAVQNGLRNFGREPPDEIVAEFREPPRFCRAPGLRNLKRLRQSHDRSHVFRAGAEILFLPSSLEYRLQARAGTDVETARALGPVDLPAIERHQVNAEALDVEVEEPGGLRCVAMKINRKSVPLALASTPGLAENLPDRGDWLDGADFVIRIHHRNKNGIRPDGSPRRIRINDPLLPDREISHIPALAGKRFERAQSGMMLERGRDEMLARKHARRTENRDVIGLGAARGENNVIGPAADDAGDGLSGAIHRVFGKAPLAVERRGIAVDSIAVGFHGFAHPRVERGGCGMVKVDFFHVANRRMIRSLA